MTQTLLNHDALSPTRIRGGALVWRLPKRRIGKLSWAVPILILVGFAIGGFGWVFVSMPLQAFRDPDTPTFFRVFLLVFLGAGMVPMGMGLIAWRIAWLIARGKTRVVLTHDRLIVKDGLAFKPWKMLLPRSRSMALNDIRQLEIIRAKKDAVDLGISDLRMLLAHHNDGGPAGEKNKNAFKNKATAPLIIAIGYPSAMVMSLTEQLLERLPPPRDPSLPRLVDTDPSSNKPDENTEPPISENTSHQAWAAPLPKPDTPIALESIDDGLSFNIPPRGIRKGSKGLLSFAVIWLLFTLPFGGFMIFGANMGLSVRLGLGAFMSLFWAIGFAMLFFAIKSGRTRAIIDVLGQGPESVLLITTKHPFGSRQRDWVARGVSSVSIGPTGTRVNNVPVMALQVITDAGRKENFLSSRTNEEIKWMASVIRAETGIAAHTPDDADEQDDDWENDEA